VRGVIFPERGGNRLQLSETLALLLEDLGFFK